MPHAGMDRWVAAVGTLASVASVAIAYQALQEQTKTAANTQLEQLVQAAGIAEWRKTWKHDYAAYKKARDGAQYFGVLGPGLSKQELGVGNTAYGPRVAQWYDQTCFGARRPEACGKVEEMRTAARNVLANLGDPTRDEAFLHDQGWAEALNVFLASAPLDAANYKRLARAGGGGGGGGRYDDVRLEDFGAIVMLLLASKEDTVNLRALDKLKSDPSRYNDADIAELTSVLTVAPTLYEQKKGYGGFRSDNLAQLRRFLEDLPVR